MTDTAHRILTFLAEGCTVEELFWHYPYLDYQDIQQAAQTALTYLQTPARTPSSIRARYPKAFARWTDEEESLLIQEFQLGQNVKACSELLNRQPGAIRMRLEKLGLLPPEQVPRRRYKQP